MYNFFGRLGYRQFLKQVAIKSTKEAIIEQDNNMTYSEVNDKIKRIAYYLKENDIQKNDKIIVYMENSANAVCTLMAISMIGAIAIPLSLKIPTKRLKEIYYDYDVVGVIYIGKNNELIGCNVLDVSRAKDMMLEEIVDNENFIFIFTSSSTGKAKGGILKQEGVWNSIQGKIEVLQLNEEDIFIQSMNIGFVASLWQMFTPLVLGAVLHIIPEEEYTNPYLLFQATERSRATVLTVIPSLLRLFCEYTKIHKKVLSLVTLKVIVTTGQMLPVGTVREYYSLYNIPLVNAYGQSECSDDTFHYRVPKNFEGKFIPIGKPVRNFKVMIDWKNQDEHIGELLISGVGVIERYVNDDMLTNERFVELRGRTYFKTGDIVQVNDDGEYVFLGRIDNMIKIRGHKVYPEEIESYLSNVDGVELAIVLDDEKAGEKFLEVIYCGEEHMEDKIKADLIQQFPEYMIPSKIHYLKNMPYNTSGKIDRQALKRNLKKIVNVISNNTIKEDREEISSIVKNYLEENSLVELNDDWQGKTFDENGIDSLLFMKIIIMLEEKLDVVFEDEFLLMGTYSNISDFLQKVEGIR